MLSPLIWRYIVWDKEKQPDEWGKAFECLVPGNQSWVKHAPILMASFANDTFTRNDKPNRWGQHDTGAASTSMALQAVSMGMMLHQMGGFDKAKLAEVFSIPDNFTPMAMIALGWPADPDKLPDDVLQREMAPRERRPLEMYFYDGAWEKGIG